MAWRDLWVAGRDYNAGDFVTDVEGFIYITPDTHRSTIENGPVPGQVASGTVGVDRAQVVEIVREMFIGHSNEEDTGIRLLFDPDSGEITMVAVRNVSFTDFSNAIQAQLRDRPAGQYWMVLNNPRTRGAA